MSNRFGIILSGGINNRIGGYTPDERNVISGNSGDGVTTNVSNSPGNQVIGNYIGVDAGGTHALPNGGDAIGLTQGGNGTLIQGNVIVPSGGNCIVIDDWGSSYNSIVGNLIGTDASGTIPLGAPGICINIGEITSFNRIGGLTPADRNVIAGEELLSGSGTLAIGNFIGTDASGTTAFAHAGVDLGTGRLFLGGAVAAERNVIRSGVQTGSGSDYSFVGGNYIGTDASGREAGSRGPSGMSISQGAHVFVQGNLIAGDNCGVMIDGGGPNTLRQNLIYDHTGGGIVLSDGGNAGISPPVIASVTSTGASGTACPGCEVEIFSDSDGQGQIFEGSTTAGASGAFVFDEGNPLAGPDITATATDTDGDTSAFSASVAAASPPANAPSDLAVTPLALQFAYVTGGALPAAQPMRVAKTGGGALEWSASSNVPWMSATPSADITPSTVTLSVAPQGLATGTSNGALTITAPGIGSRTVAVALTVSAPAPSITAVVDGAGFQPAISAGSWTTVFGANLATTTGTWRADDIVNGILPTQLDGVSVSIDGKPAAVYYVSPQQLNVQAPDDSSTGPVLVAVLNSLGATTGSANMQAVSPGLFMYDAANRKYVGAQHADYSTVGPAGLYPGSAPAQPGEIIVLYGTGFGPTAPVTPAGKVVTAAAPVVDLSAISVMIGGEQAQLKWAGITMAGVWQLNVQVPSDTPNGDAAIAAQIGGKSTPGGAFVAVHGP